ncbi:MAG TPA: heparan-alpha-glucosaminide N-acetyltransferase domain-containing protein [Bryobacteraceae bacterium]|nr:heparan-alpha-glucosaminide N-acetyltransferase domain-containing protein [Bryobacteraceae bacterium]
MKHTLEAGGPPAQRTGLSVLSPHADKRTPKLNNRNSDGRLTFLDWSRGLAVAIMLQGHVFHSFARNDIRGGGPFMLSQFLGGMGPAIFLVLTGITLAFLMDRREQQGLAPWGRWKAALRRGGYLFSLAFLFRLQLWLFAFPGSPWTDLLRVDILNCMGFAIGLMSVMALFTTAERVRLCAGLGVVIAAASPLVSSIDWRWLPPQVSAYFVPSYQYFAFFPWASFIAFGLSIGSLLRLARPEHMSRIMQWGTLGGLTLIVGGQYFSNLPYSIYPKSEFWLDSPGLIVIKLGVVMLIMAFSFVWTEFAVGSAWSWLRQLGTTSLLVYWVHIELVYGRWLGAIKESLSSVACVFGSIAVIALMIGLSVVRTKWPNIRPALAPYFSFSDPPSRVSGD